MGKKSGLITCKHCGQVIAASAKHVRTVAAKTVNRFIKSGGFGF